MNKHQMKTWQDMTDRELLELAAKAAGIELVWHGDTDPFCFAETVAGIKWNPLTNDGDALRLAVRLKIDVAHTNIHAPQVHALADAKVQVWEEIKDDPNAATRRAIVRAAAEIERNMK